MKYSKYVFIAVVSYVSIILFMSIFAPLFTAHNPLDASSIELSNARIPPIWYADGNKSFLLGTDNQGRDIFAMLLYGTRVSLFIAITAVCFAMILGVTLGLVSGYFGGIWDTLIMRLVDIKLALPSVLLAMLVSGVMRKVFNVQSTVISIIVIIVALSISTWSVYTRAIRSVVLREKQKEYVHAARLMGMSHIKIIVLHIIPNIRGMAGVIMVLDLANCIMLEAVLSFLGIGLSPNIPSLGTTIKIGTTYFLSGAWWIVTFPALTLVLLIYSINTIKDYLEESRKLS